MSMPDRSAAESCAPASPLATPQGDRRVPCPDCGGRGKIIGTVPGVPASVCTKYVTCERCWPRNDDGTKKLWDDGTAGTIPAPEAVQP